MGASTDPIKEFDNYIEKINREDSDVNSHNGYLINLERFDVFKRDLQFEQNRNLFACVGEKELILDPEETINLKDKIKANQKYIIINDRLLRKYYRRKDNGKQNHYKVEYKIFSQIISIKTENDETFIFKNNKNNIIEKNISEELKIKANSNENYTIEKNANQIYINIINYFALEKDISDKLGGENTKNEEYKGFLVYKNCIDNWKVYSHYD